MLFADQLIQLDSLELQYRKLWKRRFYTDVNGVYLFANHGNVWSTTGGTRDSNESASTLETLRNVACGLCLSITLATSSPALAAQNNQVSTFMSQMLLLGNCSEVISLRHGNYSMWSFKKISSRLYHVNTCSGLSLAHDRRNYNDSGPPLVYLTTWNRRVSLEILYILTLVWWWCSNLLSLVIHGPPSVHSNKIILTFSEDR